MKKIVRTMKVRMGAILFALGLLTLGVQSANAAGTTPLALQQEVDQNGAPLVGALLYFFVANTVATPQQVYSDFGLTMPLPNPLSTDVTGRIPMHWIADGLIHIRLTNSSGVVIMDTTLQSLGPSSGGGGGGGSVDPTAVAQTGDIKFRMATDTQIGWVLVNGTTIGSASSGATQRANADTQNLFVYLWSNCNNTVCPVIGGRGANGLADFAANKPITLPRMQDRTLVGRDCMSGTCGSVLSDLPLGNGGTGGSTTKTVTQGNLPNVNFAGTANVSGANHSHGVSSGTVGGTTSSGLAGGGSFSGPINAANVAINSSGTLSMSGGATVNSGGSNVPLNTMDPYALGNYWMKL